MSDWKTAGSKCPRVLATAACALILSVALSFAHPFGDPRQVSAQSGRLLAGAQIPDQLRVVLARKCGNCHSEAGEWPFYSRLAPASWLLERDVSEARSHMNLSHWASYSNDEQSDLLGRLAAQARSGEMPPARYTAIHPDSRLLPAEQQALYDWARAERRRLRTEGQQTTSEQR
jgi:hypothetical protein